VWDVAQARVVATVPGQARELNGVVFTPDGQSLVLSVNEGEIHIHDLPGGQRREVLYEHSRRAYSLACSDDGRLLASKSADGSVRLWRCDTWDCVAEIDEAGHDEVELAFRPGTLTLTSFDSNNTILRLWDIDYEELVMGNFAITILMLSSDPVDQGTLRLGKEQREIQEQLRQAGLRSRFIFHSRASVRPKDFSRGLLELRPRIVHFSGHGGPDGSVSLQDESGRSRPVTPEHLAALMELMSEHVDCVVLNSCHSEKLARAIARSIEYAIGTTGEVEDEAAIAFSIGFYQALGEGCTIEEAFRLGRVQFQMHCGDANGSSVVLKKKNTKKGAAQRLLARKLKD
jgi:hypothetical protein